MRQCVIVAVAEGIDPAIVERFRDSIVQSAPRTQVDIDLWVGEREGDFCKAERLNELVRRNLDKYQVIIQADIDLLIPPGLVDYSCSSVRIGHNLAYHHYLRHVSQAEIEGISYPQYRFSEWQKRKSIFCSGCWNAMSPKTWKASGGWNPDMLGWGFEDTEFFQRSKKRGIRWILDLQFGLVHVNHDPRTPRRVEENREAAARYDPLTVNWLTDRVERPL